MRFALALVALLPALASAQVPGVVGYQGRLLRADGTPESGSQSIGFALYASATDTNSLWNETQTLGLSDGYYATFLGSTTQFGSSVWTGADRYLEITVGGVALSPRQRVASIPYALVAGNIKGGTVDASSISVGGNTVIDSAGKLTGSAAYSTATGSGLTVTGNSIALASSGCLDGQVLAWKNNAWTCANAGASYTAGSGILLSNGAFSVDPAGNSFVHNQAATAQNATFNVSGTGTVGSDLSVGGGRGARLAATGSAPVNGSGLVTGTAGSGTVTASTGTAFLAEVAVGDVVLFGTTTQYQVTAVSGTTLTVTPPLAANVAGSFTVVKPIARLNAANGAAAVFVNSQGMVGVGTMNPNRALTVGGGGELSLVRQTSGYTFINVADTAGNGSGSLQLRGIDASGTVGKNLNQLDLVATMTTVAGNLNVNGAYIPGYATWGSTGAGGAAITNDNGPYKALMLVGNNSGNGSSREVGVWDNLTVSNNETVNGVMRVNGGGGGQTAAIIAPGGTYETDWPAGWGGGLATWDINAASLHYSGLSQRSDRRLKTDITSLDQAAVETLMKLRPVSYHWKDKRDAKLHYGFIAQEVQAVIPDLVDTGTDAQHTLSMSYQDLTSFLVKATQDLKSENDQLKKRLDALEARLAASAKAP